MNNTDIKFKHAIDAWIVFEMKWEKYYLEKHYIAEYWIKYWWSFIKHIWQALHIADKYNTEKILNNWYNDINIEHILNIFDELDIENNKLPF